MRVPPLALVQKACGIYIEDVHDDVLEARVTQREMLQYCTWLRQMGITKLFLSGLPDAFFVDLFKSARAYLHFLERQAAPPPHTSLAVPFFDAVVCDDVMGARGIAERSDRAWHEGKEYGDAFCYMRFLMEWGVLDAARDRVEALLAQYEGTLEGTLDVRFDLCLALYEADAGAFDDALQRFLDDLETTYRQEIASEAIPPDEAATTRRLSVEGLALVRLAERYGLETQSEYMQVPSLARRYDRAALPAADAWRAIATYYQFG